MIKTIPPGSVGFSGRIVPVRSGFGASRHQAVRLYAACAVRRGIDCGQRISPRLMLSKHGHEVDCRPRLISARAAPFFASGNRHVG